jgi:hypothetical protein
MSHENESICSECHAICTIVPMKETETSEHFGQMARHVYEWNESSCCGADVRDYDKDKDGE